MNILCYGDSNTWGYSPGSGFRFDEETRWPAVMARCLGPDHRVIEEGLNGRTIGSFMPPWNPLNGLEHLERILPSYTDLDLVIVYLGINDLFMRDDIGAEEIARNVGFAVELIQGGLEPAGTGRRDGTIAGSRPPDILLLSPLPVNIPEEYAEAYRLQIIKSECLHDEYCKVGEAYGVKVLETGRVISASLLDGVHIEAEEHRKLGNYLCSYLRNHILSRQ